MKTIYLALVAATIATASNAYTTTNCYWIGSVYTCTTFGGGTYTTTRCYTIGNTVRCTSF